MSIPLPGNGSSAGFSDTWCVLIAATCLASFSTAPSTACSRAKSLTTVPLNVSKIFSEQRVARRLAAGSGMACVPSWEYERVRGYMTMRKWFPRMRPGSLAGRFSFNASRPAETTSARYPEEPSTSSHLQGFTPCKAQAAGCRNTTVAGRRWGWRELSVPVASFSRFL